MVADKINSAHTSLRAGKAKKVPLAAPAHAKGCFSTPAISPRFLHTCIRGKVMSVTPLSLTVQDKSKSNHAGASLFKGKKVMLYFSAHWCPPCRQFTPVLAKFYADAKNANLPVECVFVSCDRDEAAMWSYFNESHGNYFVVPYDAPARKELSEQYHVSGIPCLVIVDENGKVLKENARNEVQQGDVNCINQWN